MLERIRRFLDRKSPARVRARLIESGLLSIGRHTYGGPRVEVFRGSDAKVTIGSFCSISRGVVFLTGGVHPVEWVSTFPFRIRFGLERAYDDGMPTSNGPIVVGNDVWIGTEAMILSGVTVGHGAVIAARSVVTRDVPDYAVVAGVPARVIGMRFAEDIVEDLLRIAWWTWDEEQIREAVPLLSSGDVEQFISMWGGQAAGSRRQGSACRA